MSITHPAGKFDNSARKYKHIQAIPLASAMGAEICGVQVADIDDETFADIEHALFRHKMIYFREQEISQADQELFSRRFGPFADDAYTGGVKEV